MEEITETEEGSTCGCSLRLLFLGSALACARDLDIPVSSDPRNDEKRPTAAAGRTTESRRRPASRRMSNDGSNGGTLPLSRTRGGSRPGQSRSARRPRQKPRHCWQCFIVALTGGDVSCGPPGWPPAPRYARTRGARTQKRHRGYSPLRKHKHHYGHDLSLPPERSSNSSLRARACGHETLGKSGA